MSYGTILTKGELAACATDFPVVPRQFILMSGQGNAKRLLVRFENRRKERLGSLCLAVRQYDIRGALIRKDTYEIEVSAKQGEFAPERDFPILASCEDFKLEVLFCTYGSYKYVSRDGRTQVVYENRDKRALADRTPAFRDMHEKKHYASARTLRSPLFFVPLVLLVVIALSLFIALRIRFFVNENETFTLGGMKYMLTNNAEDCTEVSFIGYLGDEEKIPVPDSVEGYKVVSVARHALKNSSVKELVVEGDAVIEPYAFSESSLVSVSLPRVQTIGEGAFMGSAELGSVSLSQTLTSIGDKAFSGCSALKEITLPSSLLSLGSEAFADADSLLSLEVPEAVEHIGDRLLNGANSIAVLTLPYIGNGRNEPTSLASLIGDVDKRGALKQLVVSTATEIGKDTFKGEHVLTTVKYTSDITAIGEGAFSGCSSLGGFTVPVSCKSVGKSAFSGCSSLVSLDFKASVTVVPEKMLEGCASLEKFDIPATVTALEPFALSGCTSLSSLTVAEGVESIGTGVISGCTSLEKLLVYEFPNGTTPLTMCNGEPLPSLKLVSLSRGTALENNAFEGFSALKSVYLPNELITIGKDAFRDCSSLEIMSIPAGVKSIGESAFLGCSSLVSVVIPSGVTAIPVSAFKNCSSLGTAELPRELNSIGHSAFLGCTRLAGISLGDSLVSLGDEAFSGCTSLAYASLGSSLEYVSKNAFAGCSSLGSVSLPSNVKELRDGAFLNCSSVTVLVIPKTVDRIGEGVFEGCSSLRELSLPFLGAGEGSNERKVSYLFSGKVPATLKKLTLDRVDEIPTGAFDGLSSIEEIVLTTCTVTEIEPFCFSNLKSLRRVVLPVSVEQLGESAFLGCSSLVSINFPESLRVIGDRAFYYCTSLSSVSLNTGLYSIGISAFLDCHALGSVIIPKSVASVGEASFMNCSSLVSYTAPFTGMNKNSPSLKTVFGTVPNSLKQITVTEGDSIGNEAFLGFSGVTDITIPDAVKRIGDKAFFGCSSLTRINIPLALKSLGESAFFGCESIKTLTLPTNVDSIGQGAFAGCSSLESLNVPFVGLTRQEPSIFYYFFGDSPWNIPKSLKRVTVSTPVSLVSSAFRNSLYIEEIVFDGGVSEIGAYALANCFSLKSITLSGELNAMRNNAFTGSERLRTVINKTGRDITDMLRDADAMDYVLCLTDDAAKLSIAVKDGFTMLLADDGEWYCVGYDIGTTGSSLVFPSEFEFGGARINSYKIARRLVFANEYLSASVSSIHISSAVSAVCERAFMGCEAATLTADATSSLCSIGAEAFLGCKALTVATLPSTLVEIGNDAFLGCESLILVYNLSNLDVAVGEDTFGYVARYAESVIEHSPLPMITVTVGDFVLEGAYDVYFLKEYVGTSGVADIRNLRYNGTELNSIIILKGAFDGSGVRRVILGECVSRVHDGAFDGANSIYEIVCLSTRVSVDLSDPDCCGGVTRNAIKLFSTADEGFTYYTVENASGRFLFAVYGSEVYLVEADVLGDTLVLPAKVADGVTDYSVFRTALDADEMDGLKLVLPLSAVSVHGDITDAASNTILMYLGTKEALDTVVDTDDFLKVLYYSNCVHDDLSFTLDADGMPTTDYTKTNVNVTKKPTCTEDGEMTESCDICHGEWTTDIVASGHSVAGGVCTVCGYREDVTVSGDSLGDYSFLSVNGSSPFVLENGTLSATLDAVDGTSVLTISALDACTVNFNYSVTGNAGAFTFAIRKGVTELVKHTSSQNTVYSLTLSRGEALVLILSSQDASVCSVTVNSLSVVYS